MSQAVAELPLWAAIAADMGATLLVIAHALRRLRTSDPEPGS